MNLAREITAYDARTEELAWHLPITEATARAIAEHLDHGYDPDLVFVYDLTGPALQLAARLAGFEVNEDLEFCLEASADDGDDPPGA